MHCQCEVRKVTSIIHRRPAAFGSAKVTHSRCAPVMHHRVGGAMSQGRDRQMGQNARTRVRRGGRVMGRAVRWVGAAASVTIVAAVTVSGGRAATPNPAIPTFTAPARADDPNIDVDRSEPATAVSADGTRYVAYQTGSQLEKSIDGGRTWLNVGGQDIVANHPGGSC